MSRGDRIVLVEEPSKTLCVGGEKGAPHDGFGESGSGIAGAFSVGSGIAFDGEEDRGPPPIGSEVPRDLLDALSHPVILLGLVFREGNPEICGEGEDLPVALFKTAPKRSEQICRTRPRADRKDKRLWPDGIR